MMTESLEPLTKAARNELAAQEIDRETHARLLGELEAMHRVDVRAPRRARADGSGPLRVVAWNAERGRDPGAGAALLARARADVLLLTELDWGMARSGQRHAARDLAERLGCGYAYGVEFIELGPGDAREAAAVGGAENEVGYHGGAILSPLPLERARVVRLESRGDWSDDALGQRRIGGRIAVVAGVSWAGAEVALASVHLESHGSPATRARELAVLIEALDAERPGGPAVIGGDLNTSTLSPLELGARDRRRIAMGDAPEHFTHPVPHEPLFEVAAAAGFEWESANLRGVPTHRTPRGPTSLKLDWILARGLDARDAEVIAAVGPTGAPLSDHDAVAATVSLR